MKRVDTPDSLFHDRNLSIGENGTVINASWLNSVQEELATLVEDLGGDPNTFDPQLFDLFETFIESGLSSKVPSSRLINGYALTSDVTLTKANIGLSSANDTADIDKPISTQTQNALNLKAPLLLPSFSDTVTITGPEGLSSPTLSTTDYTPSDQSWTDIGWEGNLNDGWLHIPGDNTNHLISTFVPNTSYVYQIELLLCLAIGGWELETDAEGSIIIECGNSEKELLYNNAIQFPYQSYKLNVYSGTAPLKIKASLDFNGRVKINYIKIVTKSIPLMVWESLPSNAVRKIELRTVNYDSSSIFLGRNVGAYTEYAQRSIGVGEDCFKKLRLGWDNVGLGANALKNGFELYDNVAVGSNAGDALGNSTTDSLEKSSGNTFIGKSAGSGSQKKSVNNSTAIGYEAYTTADNQVVIGNDDVTDVYLGSVSAAASLIAKQYKLPVLNIAPSSATDTGTLGEIRVTADFIYVCINSNQWVRTALATW